jgi:hypothetical protein
MDFKTITLADALSQKLYLARVVVHIANHEWCPAIEENPTFSSTPGCRPFADFGPTTKWILKQCDMKCDSVDTCKKISLEQAIADNTRSSAMLTNFNTIFGVSQNKKTALLIRTRKKQKNPKKKKVESEDEESEDDEEPEAEVEADAEPDDEPDDEESVDDETPESDSEDVEEEEIIDDEESDSE